MRNLSTCEFVAVSGGDGGALGSGGGYYGGGLQSKTEADAIAEQLAAGGGFGSPTAGQSLGAVAGGMAIAAATGPVGVVIAVVATIGALLNFNSPTTPAPAPTPTTPTNPPRTGP